MNDIIKQWNDNFGVVIANDILAKEKKSLVGRYISEPYADGRAYYQIIKATKFTVTIQVITDIGDDWILPIWGKKASIPRKYAEQSIQERENLDKIFNKSHAEQLI